MTSDTPGIPPQRVHGSALPRLKWALLAAAIAAIGGAVWFFVPHSDEAGAPPVPKLPNFQETKIKAEAGDAEAQTALGEIYAEGKQVRGDYREAVNWYRKAAEKENPRALFHLGALYEIGQGVPRDEAEAARLYRKAAEQGLADAQYSLAGMYGLGRGVPHNPKEALSWYQKAAAQGDALACYNLAERYERGRDVDPDLVEAYKWHALAAERGLKDGEVGVANLAKRLTRAQVADARKRVETYKASVQGKPQARP